MAYQIELTPISLIWTGDAKRKNERFLLTGLKGSLRWWYETLIRGLGGYACDPTDGGCMPQFTEQEQRRLNASTATSEEKRKLFKSKMCPACYLFGCTGWKARLGYAPVRGQKDKDVDGQLEMGKRYILPVIERRDAPLEEVEKGLLSLMFAFISDHGSICARNTLIPSEPDPTRPDVELNSYDYHDGTHHGNFGLCRLVLRENEGKVSNLPSSGDVRCFLAPGEFVAGRSNEPDWPNFINIWYDSRLIERRLLRQLVNRPPDKSNRYNYGVDKKSDDRWYGGDLGVSKKIFAFHSFKTVPENIQPRVWGYVNTNNRPHTFIETKLREKGQSDSLHWGDEFLSAKGAI